MTTTEATIQIRDGDIFRWSYTDQKTDNGEFGSYHCCSRIAVAKNGRLHDTFWHDNNGRSFGPSDFGKISVRFIANFADLEKRPEYESDYYADADIVDLNHSNSTKGNFYIRKGSVRSAEKMLQSAAYMLDRAESNERMARDKANRLRETIAKIEAGDTSVYL